MLHLGDLLLKGGPKQVQRKQCYLPKQVGLSVDPQMAPASPGSLMKTGGALHQNETFPELKIFRTATYDDRVI